MHPAIVSGVARYSPGIAADHCLTARRAAPAQTRHVYAFDAARGTLIACSPRLERHCAESLDGSVGGGSTPMVAMTHVCMRNSVDAACDAGSRRDTMVPRVYNGRFLGSVSRCLDRCRHVRTALSHQLLFCMEFWFPCLGIVGETALSVDMGKCLLNRLGAPLVEGARIGFACVTGTDDGARCADIYAPHIVPGMRCAQASSARHPTLLTCTSQYLYLGSGAAWPIAWRLDHAAAPRCATRRSQP